MTTELSASASAHAPCNIDDVEVRFGEVYTDLRAGQATVPVAILRAGVEIWAGEVWGCCGWRNPSSGLDLDGQPIARRATASGWAVTRGDGDTSGMSELIVALGWITSAPYAEIVRYVADLDVPAPEEPDGDDVWDALGGHHADLMREGEVAGAPVVAVLDGADYVFVAWPTYVNRIYLEGVVAHTIGAELAPRDSEGQLAKVEVRVDGLIVVRSTVGDLDADAIDRDLPRGWAAAQISDRWIEIARMS